MNLVFFGTPEFASRCLEKILMSRHRVLAAVTAPDKPRGRGKKVEPSDVKRLALSKRLNILQPPDLRDSTFLSQLASLGADLFCVVAFRILPEEVFSLPPRGCVNLHASLLPKYRGAAPINWAIINGETETGLTTFFIQRKVDTGNIILQERLPIGPEETFGELYQRMAERGGDLMLETLDKIEAGNIEIKIQDSSEASAAPKIESEMGQIDWTQESQKIHNLIRGFSPKPGAYTFLGGRKIIILRSRLRGSKPLDKTPGSIIEADPVKGIAVAAGDGVLELLEIKPDSGKKVTGAEYVRGHKVAIGGKFERSLGK